ncbi:MAG: MMPL family transporter [Planctomycetota bacterium]
MNDAAPDHDYHHAAGPLSWPIRRPVSTLAVAGCLAILSVLMIRTMSTDGSLAALLPAHESSAAALASISEDFEATERVTLLVSLNERTGDASDDLLDFAQRFEQVLQSDAKADALVQSVTHTWPDDAEPFIRDVVTPNLLLYLHKAGQAELRDRLSPAGMAEQMRMNDRAAAAPGVAGSSLTPLLKDPLRLRELVRGVFEDVSVSGGRPGSPMFSADRRSLLIQVTPTGTTTGSADPAATMALIRHAIEAAEPGGLKVSATGGLAIAEAAEQSIRGDMIASSIGTVVLLQLLFLLTFRRVTMFPIAFLPAAAGIVVGFGVFALTGRAISPPTAVLGALLAGLGIDYAIHYLAHRHDHPSLADCSRRLAPPFAIAGVTSLIAFGTIGLSDVTALRDFAAIGVAGLAATVLATLTVLPALLALQSRTRRPGSPALGLADSPRWRLDRVLRAAVSHGKTSTTACGMAAIAAALVLVITPGGPVRYDRDLSAMHPRPNAPLDTQQLIAQAFPGQSDTFLLYVTARSEPALLQRTTEARRALANNGPAGPFVAGSFGIDQLIPPAKDRARRQNDMADLDPQAVLADFDAAVEQSVFDSAAFADYRLYLQQLLRPGPGPGLDALKDYPGLSSGLLPRSPSLDKKGNLYTTLVTVFLERPLDDRDERAAAIEAIRSATSEIPGVTLTGVPVVGHDIEQVVQGELSRLLLIAATVVTLWLLVCFRSPRDTLVALIPVAGGVLVLFAVMKISGTGLNLINLIALPLLAGLGVDDGVFLVSAARAARQRGKDRSGLMSDLASSAQAITLTSATTALAFGSLLLTGVPAIRSLGLVVAVGILACLALSLFALAPLLVMLHRSDHEAEHSAEGSAA